MPEVFREVAEATEDKDVKFSEPGSAARAVIIPKRSESYPIKKVTPRRSR